MTRAADAGRYRPHTQALAGAGREEGVKKWCRRFGVQPVAVMLGWKDGGEAVMDGLYQVIGRPDDDGAALERLAGGRVGPALPQPGKAQSVSLGVGNESGLFLFAANVLPFVQAAGRDDATPMLERGSERRFLRHGLDPGIDGAVADLAILGPEGNQPPVRLGHLNAVIHRQPHDRDVLCGSDVVAGREVEIQPELLPESAKWGVDSEAVVWQEYWHSGASVG